MRWWRDWLDRSRWWLPLHVGLWLEERRSRGFRLLCKFGRTGMIRRRNLQSPEWLGHLRGPLHLRVARCLQSRWLSVPGIGP